MTATQYYVTGLSNLWDDDYYSQLCICSSPAADTGTTGVASLGYRSESFIYAPPAGTSTTTDWGDITGLSAGTRYTVYANVQAKNGLWYPAGSATFTTQAAPPPIPPAPTGLNYTAYTGHCQLAWNPTSYATSFEIHWTPSNLTGSTSNVSDYAGYDFLNMDANVSYDVTVYAKNSSGMSAGTTIYGVRCLAPSTVPVGSPTPTVTFSGTTANVTWNAVSGNGTTHYEVSRKKSSDATWLVHTADTTSTSATIAVDSPNTNYDFRILAFNSYGNGSYAYAYNQLSGAAPAGVPAPISPPINIYRTSPSSPTLEYMITFSGNGSPTYKVTAQLASGGTEFTKYEGAWGTVYATFDQPSTAYIVRIYAGNSAGYSAPTSQTFTTDALPVPAPVTGLSATRINPNAATLDWQVSFTGNTAATSYRVTAQLQSGGTEVDKYNGTATSQTITLDQQNTNYIIRVYAVNANGSSSAVSQTVNAGWLSTTPTDAPAVTAEFSTYTAPNYYINVYWTAVNKATYYKVFANDGSGSGDVLKADNQTGLQKQITVDKGNVTYTIKVQACSSTGCASISGTDTAFTSARPAAFEWDTPKVSGQPFNITASEWNRLTGYIDSLRKSKLGAAGFGFTTANTGTTFQAYFYNQAVNALAGLSPATPPPPTRATGDTILAADINALRDSANSV